MLEESLINNKCQWRAKNSNELAIEIESKLELDYTLVQTRCESM